MTMKLYIKALKRKPFEIKASTRLMMAATKMQLDHANFEKKIQEETKDLPDAEAGAVTMRGMLNTMQSQIDFVTDTLKLDDNLQDKLVDLEPAQVSEIAVYITQRLMGMSDEDIQLSQAENEAGLAEK
ncbi:phage tail tube assembly chaperone [Weissella cibaria]|uniref:phage tail tube assembly chaperone n=1 Tax=Weissella cibaria TaxID=137591 RepID=UPI00189819E7|nr:phage tail tube assembly chaperone [Weissella cibaria]